MTVTDAQDVRGHAATRTGVDEVLHGLREWRAGGRTTGLQPG
jgi:hypothetical protein